jgi:hypothetical protein
MFIDDAVRTAAREAVKSAGAVIECPAHPGVMIRIGDEHAEHLAYAIATTALKKEGAMTWRETIMDAIKAELDAAADRECPECSRRR